MGITCDGVNDNLCPCTPPYLVVDVAYARCIAQDHDIQCQTNVWLAIQRICVAYRPLFFIQKGPGFPLVPVTSKSRRK